MATVGTRALAYVASPMPPAAYDESTWDTATLDLRTAEKFWLPFRGVQGGSADEGPEVYIYRSTDGGASFESVAVDSYAFATAVGSDGRKIIEIEGGLYALAMVSGGGDTATMGLETAEVLSAYEGN